MNSQLEKIIKKYNSDKNRLMDILLDTQAEFGYISKEATQSVAKILNMAVVDVEQTLSFYHFFTQKSRGTNTIYLNNSAVACMMGSEEVKKHLRKPPDANSEKTVLTERLVCTILLVLV